MGIPTFGFPGDAGVERIESDPQDEDEDTGEDSFGADAPAHFRYERPDQPEEGCASDGFEEVNPERRCLAHCALQGGESEEQGEREDSRQPGRLREALSKRVQGWADAGLGHWETVDLAEVVGGYGRG